MFLGGFVKNKSIRLMIKDIILKEELLDNVNKKIDIILKRIALNNCEYDDLIGIDNDIRMKEVNKNKKLIVMSKIIVTIICFIMIMVCKEIILMFDIFSRLLFVYQFIEIFLGILIVGYEMLDYFKIIKDKEYLCKGLVNNDDYQKVLVNINDKERERKYLDMEFDSLIMEQYDLDKEIDNLKRKLLIKTGIDDIDKLINDLKNGKIKSSNKLLEQNNYENDNLVNKNKLVRRKVK